MTIARSRTRLIERARTYHPTTTPSEPQLAMNRMISALYQTLTKDACLSQLRTRAFEQYGTVYTKEALGNLIPGSMLQGPAEDSGRESRFTSCDCGASNKPLLLVRAIKGSLSSGVLVAS